MRELDKRLNQAFKKLGLKPGDIYESCTYHPVLCLGVDYKQDEIWGVSLVDGTHPMSCSLIQCGIRKLTPKQAWAIKMYGPSDSEARERIPRSKQWWNAVTHGATERVSLVGPRKERQPSSSVTASSKVRSR
jgi:hypothetical protein